MRISEIRAPVMDGQTPSGTSGDALSSDRASRQPAALWRALSSREPWLTKYDVPCRRFDTRSLLERLDRIRYDIADRGLDDRGGLPFADAKRVEALISDARALVCEEVGERSAPPPEPVLSVDTVTLCALCWRLAPLGTKRVGGRSGTTALCRLHSLADGRRNRGGRATAVRRMRRIEKMPAPLNASTFLLAKLFEEQQERGHAVRWACEIDASFPRVAAAHPLARESVLAAFDALDGLNMDAERVDLHKALATLAVSKTRSKNHDRGASLLYSMLVTRELWLRVESDIRHGGRRPGAGRKSATLQGVLPHSATLPSAAAGQAA